MNKGETIFVWQFDGDQLSDKKMEAQLEKWN